LKAMSQNPSPTC